MANKLKNTYAAKLTSDLYLNDEFADFNFTFQGEKVPVHKNILAAGSKVFRAMFYGGVKDKESVEITDSNAIAFKIFLQFFYLDEVTLTMENIEEVVKLADKYDMIDCVNTCVKFLEGQLTDENIIWAYQLAILLENQTLKNFCEKHIALNTKNIFESDRFRRCDRKTLEGVLKMDKLACDEVDVFNACISWAKYAAQQNGTDKNQVANLRTQLGDCFYFIRFAAMKIEEFTACTKSYRELFTRDEMEDIVYATTIADMKPTIFSQEPRISLDLSKWNDSPSLTCERINDINRNMVLLTFKFSVNIRVLLGELYCVPIHDGAGYGIRSFDFDIKIVEITDQSCNASVSEHIIFTGNFKTDYEQAAKIPLSKALIIHPQKTYEIRLENRQGGSVYCYHQPWRPEHKLDEQIVVKFASGRSGLIQKMSFKRC